MASRFDETVKKKETQDGSGSKNTKLLRGENSNQKLLRAGWGGGQEESSVFIHWGVNRLPWWKTWSFLTSKVSVSRVPLSQVSAAWWSLPRGSLTKVCVYLRLTPSHLGSRSGWSSRTPHPPLQCWRCGLYWISRSIRFLGAYKLQGFSFKSLGAREGGRRMLQEELRKVNRSKEQCCHMCHFLFQKHVLGEQQLKPWSVMKTSTSLLAKGLKGIRLKTDRYTHTCTKTKPITLGSPSSDQSLVPWPSGFRECHRLLKTSGRLILEAFTPMNNADLSFIANDGGRQLNGQKVHPSEAGRDHWAEEEWLKRIPTLFHLPQSGFLWLCRWAAQVKMFL